MDTNSGEIKRKVFGIGLNRTGTTTLGKCFEILGFKTAGFRPDLMFAYERGELCTVLAAADDYSAFQDWPWPLVFRELDRRYPDALFVLTVRRSPEVWFESLCAHAKKTGPTPFRRIAYGYEMPHGRMREHISIYESHNRSVREYFKEKAGRLLTVCWEQQDGWDRLCGFVNAPIPSHELPHLNRRTQN
jgi:hypothetical protein